MPIRLDHPVHPKVKSANGDLPHRTLDRIRLFAGHVTKALDNVNPDFWNGITHCLVVAALGAQGVGKSTLLNTLFQLSLPVTKDVTTTFVDMAFVRFGDIVIIVLDSEGTNSAIEARRDAAILDDVPTGESIRANYIVGSAQVVLFSVHYDVRNHHYGFISDLDAMFEGAKRQGSPTSECLVIIAIRNIDITWRDKAESEGAGISVLRVAEQRRQVFITRHPGSAKQLLPNPRDHCDPECPAPLSDQQRDALRHFVFQARRQFETVLQPEDLGRLGTDWIGYKVYVDGEQRVLNAGTKPPYVITSAARCARRNDIEAIFTVHRDRTSGLVESCVPNLLQNQSHATGCLHKGFNHYCRVGDYAWLSDGALQTRVTVLISNRQKNDVDEAARLTDMERQSVYVRNLFDLLNTHARDCVAAHWTRGRARAHDDLQKIIVCLGSRVTSLVTAMGNKELDPLLTRVLEQDPELRTMSGNSYAAIWKACYVARQQIEREMDCAFAGFLLPPMTGCHELATQARKNMLSVLDAAFARQNTRYGKFITGLPEFLASVYVYGGEVLAYAGTSGAGAALGTLFGPVGLVAGAIVGTGLAHVGLKEPISHACGKVGRAIGSFWQRSIHGWAGHRFEVRGDGGQGIRMEEMMGFGERLE